MMMMMMMMDPEIYPLKMDHRPVRLQAIFHTSLQPRLSSHILSLFCFHEKMMKKIWKVIVLYTNIRDTFVSIPSQPPRFAIVLVVVGKQESCLEWILPLWHHRSCEAFCFQGKKPGPLPRIASYETCHNLGGVNHSVGDFETLPHLLLWWISLYQSHGIPLAASVLVSWY